MKNKNLKHLEFSKNVIANFLQGGADAKTCEAPCQGGTGSCNETKITCERTLYLFICERY